MTDPEFKKTGLWLGGGIAIGLTLIVLLEVFKPIFVALAMSGMPD